MKINFPKRITPRAFPTTDGRRWPTPEAALLHEINLLDEALRVFERGVTAALPVHATGHVRARPARIGLQATGALRS